MTPSAAYSYRDPAVRFQPRRTVSVGPVGTASGIEMFSHAEEEIEAVEFTSYNLVQPDSPRSLIRRVARPAPELS